MLFQLGTTTFNRQSKASIKQQQQTMLSADSSMVAPSRYFALPNLRWFNSIESTLLNSTSILFYRFPLLHFRSFPEYNRRGLLEHSALSFFLASFFSPPFSSILFSDKTRELQTSILSSLVCWRSNRCLACCRLACHYDGE